MKNILNILLVFSFLNMYSQSNLSDRRIPSDTNVITNHSTTILGKKVNYSAQIGTQPIWDANGEVIVTLHYTCLLYTSPSPRDRQKSRMPSSA